VNLVQYHSPVPRCDKVLSIETCQAYSPWARDYQFAATLPRPTALGIAVYPWVWFHRMVYETMFTITSYIYEPWGTVTYLPYPPLTIANYTGWTVVLLSLLLIVIFWRRIWQNYALRILAAIIAFYVIVLFLQNYGMYLHTGEAVAIHGRYLIPVFPVILLVFALGFVESFKRLEPQLSARFIRYAKAGLLVVTVVLFLQGGGITNWIIRSSPGWFWQDNAYAQNAGAIARAVLSKVVLPQ
jgi:hypothetical protein